MILDIAEWVINFLVLGVGACFWMIAVGLGMLFKSTK
jgi:hypothetical protein|tara:strand:- start:229 stop:339 length:111 start_codon:yes stop_codon:yes gene_type:complete